MYDCTFKLLLVNACDLAVCLLPFDNHNNNYQLFFREYSRIDHSSHIYLNSQVQLLVNGFQDYQLARKAYPPSASLRYHERPTSTMARRTRARRTRTQPTVTQPRVAQPTTMPRFNEFPLEIRSLIWRCAASSGPMRLDLFEYTTWTYSFSRQHAIYLLPEDRKNHVLGHQRARFAVYLASKEARREGLRCFTEIPLSSMPLYLKWSECERHRLGFLPDNHPPLLVDWNVDLILVEFCYASMLRGSGGLLDFHASRFSWGSVTRFAVDDRIFCQHWGLNLVQVEAWLRRLSAVREIFFVLDSYICKQSTFHHGHRDWFEWIQRYGLALDTPLETVNIENEFVEMIAWMRGLVQRCLASAAVFRQKLIDLGRDGVEVKTVLRLP